MRHRLLLAILMLFVFTAIPVYSQAGCDLPPRLTVGSAARVTPGNSNIVRPEVSTSSENIGSIPGSGTFLVLDGPVCAGGYHWWQINYDGLIGWTFEGADGNYWLEPQFATIPPLSPENLPAIRQYAHFETTHATKLQFTPDNVLFSTAGRKIMQYESANGFAVSDAWEWLETSVASSFESLVAISRVYMDLQVLETGTQWLAIAGDNITIYADEGSGYEERFTINQQANRGRFSPDANHLFFVDENQAIQVFDTTIGQVVATLPTQPENRPVVVGPDDSINITVVGVSPDGRFLAAGSQSQVIVWQVENWMVIGSVFFESPQYFETLALNNNHIAFSVGLSNLEADTFVVPLTNIDSWATGTRVRNSSSVRNLFLSDDSSFLILATGRGLEFAALPDNELLVATGLNLNLGEGMVFVNALGTSPDGRFLAVSTNNGLSLWGAAARDS